MKKLLKFRPKKNTTYRVVNTRGVLLTLSSDMFDSPVRFANFWDKEFADVEEKSAIKSRGELFYRAFFTVKIANEDEIDLKFENGYLDNISFQKCLDMVQGVTVEIVDTRNPDEVILLYSMKCGKTTTEFSLRLKDMQIPEFPKLF